MFVVVVNLVSEYELLIKNMCVLGGDIIMLASDGVFDLIIGWQAFLQVTIG